MKRVLHLVRSGPAALPADAVAGGDTVVYTRIPECLPPVSCFRWCPDAPDAASDAASAPASESEQPSEHVPLIDSKTLCELVFAADSVVVW